MSEHHYRTERDPVGSVEIPDTALFGIHACRARNHFPATERFSPNGYRAVEMVTRAGFNAMESVSFYDTPEVKA